MYEYKNIFFQFTNASLSTKRVEDSLDDMFSLIVNEARGGWRFVQTVHPYHTNNTCMLIFERQADEESLEGRPGDVV